MTHYQVVVPSEGGDGRTRYTRVGVMFENVRQETGEVWYKLQLDFPVAAQELLAFPPRTDGTADSGDQPAVAA